MLFLKKRTTEWLKGWIGTCGQNGLSILQRNVMQCSSLLLFLFQVSTANSFYDFLYLFFIAWYLLNSLQV